MRLKLFPPVVRSDVYPWPTGCPYGGCKSSHVQLRQAIVKPLRDTQLEEVVAKRYQCRRCGRTFRVYPIGVSHDQTSARLKGVAVTFYVLGMTYQEVATTLAELRFPLSKVAVYNAVREAGGMVPRLRREGDCKSGRWDYEYVPNLGQKSFKIGGWNMTAFVPMLKISSEEEIEESMFDDNLFIRFIYHEIEQMRQTALVEPRFRVWWRKRRLLEMTLSGDGDVALTAELGAGRESEMLKRWMEDLAEAIGGEILVSEDAESGSRG